MSFTIVAMGWQAKRSSRARDHHALALATGELAAAFHYETLQSHRHGGDVVLEASLLYRFLNLVTRQRGAARDIVEDAAGHEARGLQHGADLAAQQPEVERLEILAVVVDAAAFRGLEAEQQAQQGRLAGARGAHDGDAFTRAGLEIYAVESPRPFRGVTERQVADGHSRHSALSYEHAGKIEAQLKAEVADLLARAEAADKADVPDGMSIPEELARREKRLAKLAEARAKIEARAKERYEREKAEHEAKLAARAAKAKATGKKSGGKPPQPPTVGALPTDQINLTDEESRIMPVAGGGFEQCYNAQAVVAANSLLVIAAQVVQAPNDKQQIEPLLKRIEALPAELGKPTTLLADTGYFSEANVMLCAAAQIDPMIAQGRQSHYPPLTERFAKAQPAPQNPTALDAMSYRLQTPEGKKLYALRKQTSEPVFGIIKSVMGFRQFLLRRLEKVRGEWSLVTMAWNFTTSSATASRRRQARWRLLYPEPERGGRGNKEKAAETADFTGGSA